MRALGIAAAIAAMSQGMGNGMDVLKGMFMPRFQFYGDGNPRSKHRAKHRNSGAGQRRSNGCTDWRGAPGHRQAAKDAKRHQFDRPHHYEDRMRWLERNQHVIAKREVDQARAAGPLGGRNAIIWGRP